MKIFWNSFKMLEIFPVERIFKQKILDYLKMAKNAYSSSDLPNTLFTLSTTSGLRAKVFSHEDAVVIAFKGTTLTIFGLRTGPTATDDRDVDDALFSCCATSQNMNISYVADGQILIDQIKEIYPGRSLILTGHSLGGTVASILGIKNGIFVYSFSSPGERSVIDRLGLSTSTDQIVNIGMCTDPIFTGGCAGEYSICSILGYTIHTRCHVGQVYCIPGTHSNIFHHTIDFLEQKLIDAESMNIISSEGCIECTCK